MNYVYLIKSISFVLYEWHHNTLNIFFTFGGKKFQWKQIVAELAGIFVECSFKFISRLKAYDKISKKIDIWRKAYDCALRLTSINRKTKKCSHLIWTFWNFFKNLMFVVRFKTVARLPIAVSENQPKDYFPG